VKPASCARKWQVEAARDGRLLDKDLESAIRHRETCAECAHEERELAALARELSRLPGDNRDQVSIQRSRQRLLAALNESLLEPPRRGVLLPVAGALALALASAGWLLVAHHQKADSPREARTEIVEVHAQAGARWAKHQETSRIFVDFEDGAASFEIHPHPGRSVVIRLPDGEVLDIGTVFDVRVAEQHTEHVAVSEGRVSVRLNGRSTVNLGAGEAWDSEPAPPVSSALALAPSGASPATPAAGPQLAAGKATASTPSRSEKPAPQVRSSAALQAPAAPAPSAQAQDSRPAPSAQSTKAEDDAYLHIVDLLREAKDAEARARAKDYLLRFPTGFRRIEVLNIATRGARDAGTDGAPGALQ
jgi:ferric-dicitrate binding protein FerR (iron transport regulator)